jgi:hypothetical protein
VILLLGLYDPGPRRRAEMEECLSANLANPHISEVRAWVEDENLAAWPARPKMTVYHARRRLMFVDYFTHANTHPGKTFIVANSDISFDETLSLLDRIDWTDTLVCLSRTEPNGMPPFWDVENLKHYGDPAFHWPDNSQDAWIFRAPIRPMNAPWNVGGEWCLGVPGCDNRIAQIAYAAGIRIVNPFPEVRALHHHAMRRAHASKSLAGLYRDVPPCRIADLI